MLPGLFVWCEAGLYACALVLPTLLALVPRGAAPLAGVAGLCAAGAIVADPSRGLTGLRFPAAMLGVLLLWGVLSATWAFDPWRSVALDVRLAGSFIAALALAAAASRIATPWRLALFLLAGTGFAIIVALADWTTAGGISRYVTVRPFAGPRFNQIAVWLALLVLPAAALLVCRGRVLLAIIAATTMTGMVYFLDGLAAKTALALSLPVGALIYFRQRLVCRIAAALSVIAILTAPLTLPRLDEIPAVMAEAGSLKSSATHRLLIWSFVGDRIAERPMRGWGLDSSRSIPGGQVEIRPGQKLLPLHPHNAALQVWLELGVPGAVLLALFVAWLWLRLAAAPWPRPYAAAAGGSLSAALAVAFAGWGIWQEWWIATLGMAAFAILVMARATTRAG